MIDVKHVPVAAVEAPPVRRSRRPTGALRALDGRLAVAETVLGGVLVAGIEVIVLWQVGMRYLFEQPIAWTEELSRFLFIWVSLLGAALAFQRGTHFLFDQLVLGLPAKVRTAVSGVTRVLIAVMLLGGVIFGGQLAYMARVERSAALNLPMVWIYAAMPISAALMLIHLAAQAAASHHNEGGVARWL